jgi:hypothetical protein
LRRGLRAPENVTAPFVEIDPEAILIIPSLDATVRGNEAIQRDASLWHIVDVERALTWCGLFLSRGSERHRLSETPEDRRCETCISAFGEDVVRS